MIETKSVRKQRSFLWALMLLPAIFCFAACTMKTTSSLGSTAETKTSESNQPQGYLIDENQDGNYVYIVTEKRPVLFNETEFYQLLGEAIRYPASARENGIAGQVMLQASVNELGFVTKIDVIKSLDDACDEAAKHAFNKATKNGYGQLKWNGNFVRYKVDYPIRFQLP